MLILLAIGGVVYELNQRALRIDRVQIFGADQSLADMVYAQLEGTYLGIIPRDSTFFFPASRIRADVIDRYPHIAAVSIFRNGFTGLSVRVSDRVPVARWCGATYTESSSVPCYVFDASGYVFAFDATSTEPINRARLYTPLEDTGAEPLRATVGNAEKLPAVFEFARQLGTLGSLVSRIVIREDEVDHVLASGTRVTYVLGQEQSAFTALMSSKQNITLTDGSVAYVDLRFDGKVYVQREEAPK